MHQFSVFLFVFLFFGDFLRFSFFFRMFQVFFYKCIITIDSISSRLHPRERNDENKLQRSFISIADEFTFRTGVREKNFTGEINKSEMILTLDGSRAR